MVFFVVKKLKNFDFFIFNEANMDFTTNIYKIIYINNFLYYNLFD